MDTGLALEGTARRPRLAGRAERCGCAGSDRGRCDCDGDKNTLAALVKGARCEFFDSGKLRTFFYFWLMRAALLYVRQLIRSHPARTVLSPLSRLGAMKVKPVWLYAWFTGTVQVAMRDRQ